MSDPVSPQAQAPARRPRRWVPYVAGALAFLVTLVLVGTLVSDWAARNYEMRTLLTRIEASETAMGDLQTDVEEILARYQA
ncbi:MAG: hypothetical protein NTX29_10860, partial [Actinobacteria bacterium]|nr:hypothetical protein [Actinomycetota bacterium]